MSEKHNIKRILEEESGIFSDFDNLVSTIQESLKPLQLLQTPNSISTKRLYKRTYPSLYNIFKYKNNNGI